MLCPVATVSDICAVTVHGDINIMDEVEHYDELDIGKGLATHDIENTERGVGCGHLHRNLRICAKMP